MEIKKLATAGTLESSDVYVEIAPGEGLEIFVESVVQGQFGESIRSVAQAVLQEQNVTSACVRVMDRGALECVLRARMETAILRGREAN